MTTADLLRSLNYVPEANNHDETVLWMLAEITVLRRLLSGVVHSIERWDDWPEYEEAREMYP